MQALHIAAAEGNLTISRVLVEYGASLGVRDRWGFSPLEEARRVNAGPVIEYYEACLATGVAAGDDGMSDTGGGGNGGGGGGQQRLSSVARFDIFE